MKVRVTYTGHNVIKDEQGRKHTAFDVWESERGWVVAQNPGRVMPVSDFRELVDGMKYDHVQNMAQRLDINSMQKDELLREKVKATVDTEYTPELPEDESDEEEDDE